MEQSATTQNTKQTQTAWINSLSLEELRTLYNEQDEGTLKGRRTQDLITRKVLKQFEFYIYKNVGKKSNFITSYDFDDWKSIIQTAVWSGFKKKDGHAIVLYDIVNTVQNVIATEVQTLSAVKRGYFQETSVDFLEDIAIHESVSYTSQWLNNMEIQRILNNMPEKKRIVVQYYLEGYPVLSNKWNEPQVGPCIKKFTGMQDCTLYNWINEFIELAQKEMNVPKELTGTTLAGVAYHFEKSSGKKRKYPIIVDDSGNEMFTSAYYKNKQKARVQEKSYR